MIIVINIIKIKEKRIVIEVKIIKENIEVKIILNNKVKEVIKKEEVSGRSKREESNDKEAKEIKIKLKRIGKMRFIIEQVRLLILPPPSLHSVQMPPRVLQI